MNSRRKFIALRAAFLMAAVCFVWTATLGGEEQKFNYISYHLKMSRPQSHLFEVEMAVQVDGKAGDFIDFQMPRWSPGRYAVFDFSKNVQEFQAKGKPCTFNQKCAYLATPFMRVDDQTWRVESRGLQAFVINYKVFGDDLSGTFSQLDERHANFNGGSIFMYIAGHKQDKVSLMITPPEGWRITNGRMESADQRVWEFPNYDILIDTPTEIAPDWTVDEFKVDGKTYRVVVHSFGDEGGKRPQLVRDIEKIVRAETRMWGAPDFESYTFLIHFAADDRSGDGMEHLTSTQIIEPGALAESDSYEGAIGTAAHEFFHVWNVKRMRPVELGPWDFTRPLATRSLWIAEGITNYYGHMMLHRAGLWTEAQILTSISNTIGGIENSPGSAWMSPEEASLIAPLRDRAVSAQRVDLANTAVSYYPKGETIGIVLDLMIRGRTGGKKSLDDVMREMYRRFYLQSPNATYYLRGRGYTGEDFERVATEIAGFDLHEFFENYVRHAKQPPYDEALSFVGLRLVRTPASEPFNAGITMDWEEGGEGVPIGSVRHNSPAEDAGLSQGDVILSIGGEKVTRENWRAALSRYKQGQRVPVTARRDRRTIQTNITLGPPDRINYRIEERPDATPQMRALRAAWLQGK
ncbi:MAG: M61 family metallopeptidase [Pyrinomonadaceae bacterium]|nr:M61 family metallopeptidase [Pyrinomonadaceae bacterium]